MKRLLDVGLIVAMLPLLVPILLLTAIAVAIKLRRPILFSQIRPGLHGRPFRMYKFRSMLDEHDADGRLLPDEARLTRFGQLLRASSLDELPALWNVLRGDMSLVGPRPLLMEYLPLYTAEEMRRHDVRPGITGWAQINGRNQLDWSDRFRFDLWYVDNQTTRLDLKILLLTVLRVCDREGIAADGHATMPRFTGSHSGDNER